GESSVASGIESTAMGQLSEAGGSISTAMGNRAKANHDGTFVYADASSLDDFASTANNQFLIKATGGVGIGNNAPHHQLRISGGPPWTTAAWGGALELDNGSAIGWNANLAGNRFGIGQ